MHIITILITSIIGFWKIRTYLNGRIKILHYFYDCIHDGQEKKVPLVGLEPTILGLGGQCLIH